jgi:hypothetical protein
MPGSNFAHYYVHLNAFFSPAIFQEWPGDFVESTILKR